MNLALANVPIVAGLTTIPFDTSDYDGLGEIDLANHWFTPKTSGYYLLLAQMFLVYTVVNDIVRLEITDNVGTLVSWSRLVTPNVGNHQITLSCATIKYLPAGSHVFVRVQVGAASTIQLGTQYTYFIARKII